MAQCKECKFFQEDTNNSDYGFCKGNRVLSGSEARNCALKSFQRRIEPWLVDPYTHFFKTLKSNVQKFFDNKNDEDLYTLHDVSHCMNVEKMAKVIVSKSDEFFSALERFILSCASWTHDLGMNNEISGNYFYDVNIYGNKSDSFKHRRDEHHNASSWFISNNYKSLFDVQETDELLLSAIRIISSLIQYHRKKEDLKLCQEKTTVKGEIVRTRLLAAIFRLADTLHKDASRFDPDIYAMIQLSSTHRSSRFHWLKSYVVSNIHLDEIEQAITIQLALPDFAEFIGPNDRYDLRYTSNIASNWEERIRNLEYIISTDIEEDLVVVNHEFAKNGMPTYVNVRTPVTYVRGYKKKYFSDIDSMLSELDILFSPNTSKVISQAIDSLRLHYLTPFSDKKKFQNVSNQIYDYLKEIYDDRPCHVGLGKILRLLEPHLKESELKKKQIAEMLSNIYKHREESIKKICDKANLIITDNVTRIILIGYSSIIISLLQSLSYIRNREKEEIEIIVLECSPKRRLGHSNVIEYNDGIHYANEVGKIGYFNVRIWPDIGIASLLAEEFARSPELQKSTLVLFGANGIDQEVGDCGHTCGHLAIAIVADYFKIPVKVVADSFKIGEIKWDISAERKGPWLVTQRKYVEELKNNFVAIKNLREDRIPINLIWEIHTEYDVVSFRNTQTDEFCIEDGKSEFQKIVIQTKQFLEQLSDDIRRSTA